MGTEKYRQRLDECGVYGRIFFLDPGTKKQSVVYPYKSHCQTNCKTCNEDPCLGMLSFCGFRTLCVFTSNLNAHRMEQLCRKRLLTSTKGCFTTGTENWILREENDPKHRSRLCTSYYLENCITSDANSVENM
ncbi:hypothetical protein Trydic_g539 [Trypoxylus dichotomus]